MSIERVIGAIVCAAGVQREMEQKLEKKCSKIFSQQKDRERAKRLYRILYNSTSHLRNFFVVVPTLNFLGWLMYPPGVFCYFFFITTLFVVLFVSVNLPEMNSAFVMLKKMVSKNPQEYNRIWLLLKPMFNIIRRNTADHIYYAAIKGERKFPLL